jgi:hypothetical protein
MEAPGLGSGLRLRPPCGERSAPWGCALSRSAFWAVGVGAMGLEGGWGAHSMDLKLRDIRA